MSTSIRKILPPGALPTTALPNPLYTPENPPDGKKPACDCARVFKVSMGKNRVSTAVPANPPAINADEKAVGVDIVVMRSVFDSRIN